MRRPFVMAIVALFVSSTLMGCRRDQAGDVDRPEPAVQMTGTANKAVSTEDPTPGSAVADGSSSGDGGVPAAPGSIDLLRGVRTDLAVSSAYRKNRVQAERLVDGDFETAWNSRSDDLVGAWIEARLPDDATVTSIALTVGFTKRNGDNDLFTGNQRISKVRVLRAGRELGVFELDINSRELQTLPVKGPGGVYRIEVAGVVSGTRTDWREVCVSELRVMGNAPEVHEGERFPRLDVGKLPEPRPEPGSGDRAEVGRKLRQLTHWFATEWGDLVEEQSSRSASSALSEDDGEMTETYRLKRRQIFEQVANLVDLVDEVQADRLRYAAIKRQSQPSSGWTIIHQDDYRVLSAGFDAVVGWIGEDDASCRWAKVDGRLRLRRVVDEVRASDFSCEHLSMDSPEGSPPASAELRRECSAVERLLPRVEDLLTLWEDNPRGAAARIEGTELTNLPARAQGEWSALKARIGTVRQSCGWSS